MQLHLLSLLTFLFMRMSLLRQNIYLQILILSHSLFVFCLTEVTCYKYLRFLLSLSAEAFESSLLCFLVLYYFPIWNICCVFWCGILLDFCLSLCSMFVGHISTPLIARLNIFCFLYGPSLFFRDQYCFLGSRVAMSCERL